MKDSEGSLYRYLRTILAGVALVMPSAWAGITYDLGTATVLQTNRGNLISLFPAYDASIADPYTLTVLANGLTKNVSYLAPGVYLDDQDLTYGGQYTYILSLSYSNTNYSAVRSVTMVSNTFVTNSLTLISNLGPPALRTLGTLDARVIFQSNSLASNTAFSFIMVTNPSTATYRFRGRAFMEYQLTDNDSNATLVLPLPFTLQYHLTLTNAAYVYLPGFYGTNIHLTNRQDLSIATWDGRTWVPRNTFYDVSNQRLTLSALVSEEGNFGIVYRAWGNGAPNAEQAVVSSRLIAPASSDVNFRTFHMTFQNENAEAVKFVVYDLRGRSVYENQSSFATSVVWDGITKEGRFAPPGVYVYVLKIGTSDTRNYKGSFIVMGQ